MSQPKIDFSLRVQPQEDGWRLDRWFREHYAQWGRGHLQKLLRKGQIRVEGKRAQAATRLQAGHNIKLPQHLVDGSMNSLPARQQTNLSPDDQAWLQSQILFEDETIIVFNKPFGLAVQGGSKTSKSLDNMLKAFYKESDIMPRLVHRLDRDTSGLLLFAQSAAQAQKLADQFRKRSVQKIYYAIVAGHPPEKQGIMDAPLAKNLVGGQEIVQYDPQGQSAVTDYQVMAKTKNYSLLQLKPLTGRTHQLRVHCLLLGTPILGDHKYARLAEEPQKSQACGFKELFLHAKHLSFNHPTTDEIMEFDAPWPDYFENFMKENKFSKGAGIVRRG